MYTSIKPVYAPKLSIMQIVYCFILAFLLGNLSATQAQDSHYWTQQYGARASLLGGAVIHGIDDNSTVYYNPANLVFIQHKTISLNTSIYKYEDATISDALGEDLDLKSQRVSIFQNMISGLLTKDPDERYRIGFNILARNNANFDYNQYFESTFELIPDYPGKETYTGSSELRTTLSETWGCLGAGYRLNNNMSLGLTLIATYRNQKHTFGYIARAFNDSLAASGNNPILYAENSYFSHSRSNVVNFLAKFSFHARFNKWRLGLNITSPSLTIFGEGRVQRDIYLLNLPGNLDLIKTGNQRTLPAEFRYPITIGLGAAYLYPSGMLSIAIEYFGEVGAYKMVSALPIDATTPTNRGPGVEDFLSVHQGARAVLNFGIGWEQKISEKIIFHMGLRTDFSYAKNRPDLAGLHTIVHVPVDLFHLSAGLSFKRKASRISFGINYSYAQGRGRQILNLTAPIIDIQQQLFLTGIPSNSAFVYSHSATLLIGYTYYFALK